MTGPHAVAFWGRDEERVADWAERSSFAAFIEETHDGTDRYCYVFPSLAIAGDFSMSMPRDLHVMKTKAFAAGEHGEFHSLTAVATLYFDGRVFTIDHRLGVGYADSAAAYMWNDGNHSCDCNRTLFINRKYGTNYDGACGEAVELVSLDFVHTALVCRPLLAGVPE